MNQGIFHIYQEPSVLSLTDALKYFREKMTMRFFHEDGEEIMVEALVDNDEDMTHMIVSRADLIINRKTLCLAHRWDATQYDCYAFYAAIEDGNLRDCDLDVDEEMATWDIAEFGKPSPEQIAVKRDLFACTQLERISTYELAFATGIDKIDERDVAEFTARQAFVKANDHVEWNGSDLTFPIDRDEVHFQLWRDQEGGEA